MYPNDRTFEWDEAKREATLTKHKIDFLRAIRVFDAAHVVTEARSEIEQRRKATGQVDGVFVTVVFTIRGTAHRIITARRARHDEIRAYHESHGF